MREIKFRGKTYSGKWIYGSLVYSQNVEPAIYFEKGKGEVKWMDWLIVNPDTIGQFTGRKDINEREIYEGDIVRFEWGGYDEERPYDTYIGRMEYDESDAQFSVYSPELDFNVSLVGIDCEVLGNIHDNPELLK